MRPIHIEETLVGAGRGCGGRTPRGGDGLLQCGAGKAGRRGDSGRGAPAARGAPLGPRPFLGQGPGHREPARHARAETAHEKLAFRGALKAGRCLVLEDGFYEWAVLGGRKVPVHFTVPGREVFAFAGLWERWRPEGGEELRARTLLTVETNEGVRPYHHRMLAILTSEDEEAWLSSQTPPEAVRALLRPYGGVLEATPALGGR